MKSEFEKLLEAIGSLEIERTELEQELDKAKRVTASGGVSNDPSVERMKDRFLKVNIIFEITTALICENL